MITNEGVNFESKVVGDKLIRITPVDSNEKICKNEIVLTQQEFTECYKRWILPFVSQFNSNGLNVGASWETK